MRKLRFISLVIPLCLMVGCSWFQGKKEKPQTPKRVSESRIVDSERLREGGKIVIAPFRPGPNIEANQELTQISLRVVKGIADTLIEHKTPLTVVLSEEVSSGDFVMKGHVVAKQISSKWKRWMWKPREKKLSVKGELIDRDTGKVVLYFSQTRASTDARKDYKQLGVELGAQVGDYVLSVFSD